jgi:transcription antitermination factor NusG
VIHSPLFPGYVFVRSAGTLDARVAVLRTNGVISFVGVRGLGTPIPEEEITAIQAVLAEKIPFEPYPFLKVGQRVRIRGGSLDGIKGILTAVRGDQSLIISVEVIQRSISMRVSGYLVEPE